MKTFCCWSVLAASCIAVPAAAQTGTVAGIVIDDRTDSPSEAWRSTWRTPGARVDRWSPARSTTASPWVNAELRLSRGTRLRGGTGIDRQFPDLDTLMPIVPSGGLVIEF